MPHTAQPLTLVVTITAKPGLRDTVRKVLLHLERETAKEPGNLCYIVHELLDNPDQFLIYENWVNQAALDLHMETPYLRDFIARQDELLACKTDGRFGNILAPRPLSWPERINALP